MTSKPNFLRRAWTRYAKLGKGVKKNQKWRRPTGRDNKMREKRRGKPAVVSVGYKASKKEVKEIVVVNTLKELERVKGPVVIGSVGNKKKIELVEKAKEKGIEVSNLNVNKFLKKVNKKSKKEDKK
jgi:large subunit ribosomal protein L32e|tara:strand:- start:16551 stop:16928 length:378 start_codon:yes stop_codon:yes gene_type:complete